MKPSNPDFAVRVIFGHEEVPLRDYFFLGFLSKSNKELFVFSYWFLRATASSSCKNGHGIAQKEKVPSVAMGQKENPNGDHRWLGLFFLLPVGFFGYRAFLTHSHVFYI